MAKLSRKCSDLAAVYTKMEMSLLDIETLEAEDFGVLMKEYITIIDTTKEMQAMVCQLVLDF